MQTFLPYRDFRESLKSLDYRRLGKQRVETHQVLNVLLERTQTKGWRNHPITKMWRGYENALKVYFNICVQEWVGRGYKNNMKLEKISGEVVYPPWIGAELFHSSHRANLLRKDLVYYSAHGWNEDPTDPYAWFDVSVGEWYLQHVGTGKREYIG
mgnify:FL=1